MLMHWFTYLIYVMAMIVLYLTSHKPSLATPPLCISMEGSGITRIIDLWKSCSPIRLQNTCGVSIFIDVHLVNGSKQMPSQTQNIFILWRRSQDVSSLAKSSTLSVRFTPNVTQRTFTCHTFSPPFWLLGNMRCCTYNYVT